MKSSTETLASAMLTLSRDIYCEDGVATASIAEASTRLLEQRDEIASLRDAIRRLAEQDATLSVCEGNVTVTIDATLTDAERGAIADAADRYAALAPESAETVATLRGLLERMSPPPT